MCGHVCCKLVWMEIGRCVKQEMNAYGILRLQLQD